VPIINPDGSYMKNLLMRFNFNRADLNRDFPNPKIRFEGLKQPETRHLVGFIERDLEEEKAVLKLTLDYHCCGERLFYPWTYKRNAISDEALEKHRVLGRIVTEKFGYLHGSPAELKGYKAVGTSVDYFHARYGAMALVFEAKRGLEDRNWELHKEMWEEFVEFVNNN